MNNPDYYRILGVAPESEDVVIQAAYRALMRRYHPDTNKSADAAKRATEINQAYDVLRDPVRRRQYDAVRKAAGDAKKQESESPPPPPPPPQGAYPSKQPARAPWDDLGTRIVVGLIGTFLLVVIVGALSESGSTATDNNLMAVENLEAGNLVVENDMELVDANDAGTELIATAPPTLATLTQTPVHYDDIESAASRFAKVLTKSGIAGARTVSEKCHAGVTAEPSWAAADWCAAFDYAAAHVDAEVAKSAGWPANPYFQFQAANQADRYKEAGASDYFVSSRLVSIKESAESAADDATMAEIAKVNSQSKPVSPPEPSPPDESHSLSQQWLDNALNTQSTNRVRDNN